MYITTPLLMASESAAIAPVWVGILGTLVTAIVTIWGLFYVRWKEDRQRAIESELKHPFMGQLEKRCHKTQPAALTVTANLFCGA
jgi:hypothetical protein